ncbi:Peptidoglycan/xylan/chitin deacetylase, PgdA/CDA1 family [Chitinophaga ginsengisegetis]|uniref:Peptidoglycan/xylan/chitin deacetylase, PgdA/CDA1 family n=1 Tax=Chitinophaga ginsengisegetis TaxID=393003 RepID=A0A1T5NBP9_9BACT|nr:polysaccharide deacetylase family protein [Chitinophaga ginsengisegetis]SKC97930.1 Peptidoglycan/xylan/chitin deacetylase, PgdA/CDA1 family [Chitinophaga ginsengisegetis]
MKYLILLFVMALAAKNASAQNIPVLCYHQIYTGGNHKNDLLHISWEQLNNQLKTLADSGYHTILPDELLMYLTEKKTISPGSFIITFDDSHKEHFSIADSLLRRYGFRGVFFVMTVTIEKPGYMTAAQIKELAGHGHIVAAHTWDHPHLYTTGKMDWEKQLIHPRKVLEKITGKPVWYFAYPFGEWNDTIISYLKKNGYRAAFQLNGRRENTVYTIRRMMVDGRWSGTRLQQEMTRFNKGD